MSFCITGFGVEYATRFTFVPAWRACAAPAKRKTIGRASAKVRIRRMDDLSWETLLI
jgi:hypothetical protein